MHLNVLSRAATKQRTCALSDTLSARVLLCDQGPQCHGFDSNCGIWFLLTTTAAIAIALFAIYRQHQLFPFSDVQEAAEHFNSDGRWTLVEIHGDTNGPYDWTGGGSFNNDIQKSMSYTINSDHKTHNFQLSTHNRNRGESVRYSRFTNPQDNDLLLIFVSNHDR